MHYTLASGHRQVSVTSRCPLCMTVKYHAITRAQSHENLTYDELCCGPEHGEAWRERVTALLRREDVYEAMVKVYGPTATDLFLDLELLISPILPNVVAELVMEP